MENERTGQPSGNEGTRPYIASGGAPQQYGNYAREAQPFSDSGNEWQRVGHSSDQNWWESGTRQQQQAYRGETGYPYRENYSERNQQGQRGVENLYPQEPASEQQKQNFAEGSQYPYEGGFGAENIQARQGLERAKEWPDQDLNQPLDRRQNTQTQREGWRNNPSQNTGPNRFNYQNQRTNQNPNTMRSDERNSRRDYNDYREQEYRRDRNRMEERGYGYDPGRREQDWDRSYDRRGYSADREFNRGYAQDRDYNRGQSYDRRYDYEQGRNYNQNRGHNQGRYHSTETDVPGRGYDTEREMNRHANNYSGYEDRNRNFEDRNQNSRRVLNNSVASSHRDTGPYEDFERDLDRYNIRGDYQERYGSYRQGERDRGESRDRGQYFRPEEALEGRRRVSERYRDRGLERSPSGNWGPSESEYNNRYRGGRDRY